MLIVNNGAPKTGTVRLHSVLCNFVPYKAPSRSWWTPGWTGATVDPTRLKQYLETVDLSETTLFKAHYPPRFRPVLDRPGVLVINCTRYLPDVVVSMYHHRVRHEGLTKLLPEWAANEGRTVASHHLAYHSAWNDIAYVVSYEQFHDDAIGTILRLSEAVGFPLQEAKARQIAEKTSFDQMKTRIGGHARKGGVGTSRGELPPDLFTEFDIMDTYTDRSLLV